jgi:hypothetical protein
MQLQKAKEDRTASAGTPKIGEEGVDTKMCLEDWWKKPYNMGKHGKESGS